MITFKRPSGTTITVNDTKENRAHAESQGWVEVKAEKPKPKSKAK